MKTLYEYLNDPNLDEEVTVLDNEYDMEVYFEPIKYYNKSDLWDNNMIELSKKLNIIKDRLTFEDRHPYVIVDFSELIERNINNGVFEKIFKINRTDNIMYDMENIMSGNVSETWFDTFVKSLV